MRTSIKVNGVRNISNKNQSPSNLAKYQYFYTRDFISFLHFEIKLALSIVKVFRNIFTQDTLDPSFISKKVCTLHCTSFQKYPLFTIFLPVFTVDEVCNISNKYRSPKNLPKH